MVRRCWVRWLRCSRPLPAPSSPGRSVPGRCCGTSELPIELRALRPRARSAGTNWCTPVQFVKAQPLPVYRFFLDGLGEEIFKMGVLHGSSSLAGESRLALLYVRPIRPRAAGYVVKSCSQAGTGEDEAEDGFVGEWRISVLGTLLWLVPAERWAFCSGHQDYKSRPAALGDIAGRH
jgi:hypothetical protein